MTLRARAEDIGAAYDATVAAASSDYQQDFLEELALYIVNNICKMAGCDTTAGTDTAVNFASDSSDVNLTFLGTDDPLVYIGTPAQILTGSGLAVSSVALNSVDVENKTGVLASARSRALTTADIVVDRAILIALALGDPWVIVGESTTATNTVESMNFRYRHPSGGSAVLEVQGVTDQGVSTWYQVSSLLGLHNLLSSGKVS